MGYKWYKVNIRDTDSDNFTTSISLGAISVEFRFMRITAPLFGDQKWRCWATFNGEDTRQVSLFTASWQEYENYKFYTVRSIKYPKPTELSIAFSLYLGVDEELLQEA